MFGIGLAPAAQATTAAANIVSQLRIVNACGGVCTLVTDVLEDGDYSCLEVVSTTPTQRAADCTLVSQAFEVGQALVDLAAHCADGTAPLCAGAWAEVEAAGSTVAGCLGDGLAETNLSLAPLGVATAPRGGACAVVMAELVDVATSTSDCIRDKHACAVSDLPRVFTEPASPPADDPAPPAPAADTQAEPDPTAAVVGLTEGNGAAVSGMGAVDLADEALAATRYAEAMGQYAAAAIVARDQMGITPYADLAVELEFALTERIDEYLLYGIEGLTPQMDLGPSEDAIMHEAFHLLDSLWPTSGTRSSHQGAQQAWGELNPHEKEVCGNHPYDCYRARNTNPLAYESAVEWYPRFGGHNDVRDAFRHCVWNAFMVKRANRKFAKAMATAHETGASGQPRREYDMDMYNNWWGREAGDKWDDDVDQRHEEQCVSYARPPRDLTWYVGTVTDGNRYK